MSMSEYEKTLPPQCLACPNVQSLLHALKHGEERKEQIAEQAMGRAPDEVAEQVVEHLAEFGVPVPDKGMISTDLRKSAANLLDFMDESATDLMNFGNVFVMGCRGLLRIRAARDGIVYTAAICTSPAAPSGENTEMTVITRQT